MKDCALLLIRFKLVGLLVLCAACFAGNPAKGKAIESERVLLAKVQPVANEQPVPVEKAPVGEETRPALVGDDESVLMALQGGMHRDQ